MRHQLTAAQSESEYYKGRYNDLCNTLSAEKHNLGANSFLKYNTSLLQRLNFSAVMYRVYQPRQKTAANTQEPVHNAQEQQE